MVNNEEVTVKPYPVQQWRSEWAAEGYIVTLNGFLSTVFVFEHLQHKMIRCRSGSKQPFSEGDEHL